MNGYPSFYPRIALVAPSPNSKVSGANMGPTWALSAPDGPHVDPMNLAIRDYVNRYIYIIYMCVCAFSVFFLLDPGVAHADVGRYCRKYTQPYRGDSKVHQT